MPSMVRHVAPVAPERATGPVAAVYAQVESEFGGVGPPALMASPAPELLAAIWAALREAQLVGDVCAWEKTLAALGVAQGNGCAYDATSYGAALSLMATPATAQAAAELAVGRDPTDPRLAALLRWARSTATGKAVAAPPVPYDQRAEFLATVLFTHFIDRMMLTLLPPGPDPGACTGTVPSPFACEPVPCDDRPGRTPGAAFALIGDHPRGAPVAWGDGPAATVYAVLAATASRGGALLSPAANAVVTKVVAAHRGRLTRSAPTGAARLDALIPDDRAAARVAIAAALSPSRLTDADVAAWRATDPRLGDHDTVRLLAYGAVTAVGHIEADLARAVLA